jgi:hypothetical protein
MIFDRTQYQIRLRSLHIYDNLGRVLDFLCKMEFELAELRVVNTNGTAEIAISFLPVGRHSVDALLIRIGQVVGITQVPSEDWGDGAQKRQSSAEDCVRD